MRHIGGSATSEQRRRVDSPANTQHSGDRLRFALEVPAQPLRQRLVPTGSPVSGKDIIDYTRCSLYHAPGIARWAKRAVCARRRSGGHARSSASDHDYRLSMASVHSAHAAALTALARCVPIAVPTGRDPRYACSASGTSSVPINDISHFRVFLFLLSIKRNHGKCTALCYCV